MTTTKSTANQYGVFWSPSKSGRIQIALREQVRAANADYEAVSVGWEVWGLYTGTHDRAPISKMFKVEADARAYANQLWRTR